MERSSNARRSSATLAALFTGFMWLGAAGCGEEADKVEQTQSPITGGWTNLQLLPGWQNYWGTSNPPAVGIVNGVVTFRGAIKATNPTSDVAFRLDSPAFDAFVPYPADNTMMRTVMSGGAGGTLFFRINGAIANEMHVIQDGVLEGQVGDAAKLFTSLDGVTYDREPGPPFQYDYNVWESLYSFRQNPLGSCTGQYPDCGVYVKLVNGFVRFQGRLKAHDGVTWNFEKLFTLPSSQFIPGQTVVVPVSLGGDAPPFQSWGGLTIQSNGDVVLWGNPENASKAVSFEGVAFSKTNSGNIPLPLQNNWIPFSARQVKVGNSGGVVRFQGAIKNLMQPVSTTIATLPVGYRPAKTVRLVAAANGPVPATIVVNTSGVVTFENVPASVAAVSLSLDSVSFGI